MKHATVAGIVALSQRKQALFMEWPEWLRNVPSGLPACASDMGEEQEFSFNRLTEFCLNNNMKYEQEFRELCPVCRVIVDAALEGNNILPAYHNGKYGDAWLKENAK